MLLGNPFCHRNRCYSTWLSDANGKNPALGEICQFQNVLRNLRRFSTPCLRHDQDDVIFDNLFANLMSILKRKNCRKGEALGQWMEWELFKIAECSSPCKREDSSSLPRWNCDCPPLSSSYPPQPKIKNPSHFLSFIDWLNEYVPVRNRHTTWLADESQSKCSKLQPRILFLRIRIANLMDLSLETNNKDVVKDSRVLIKKNNGGLMFDLESIEFGWCAMCDQWLKTWVKASQLCVHRRLSRHNRAWLSVKD